MTDLLTVTGLSKSFTVKGANGTEELLTAVDDVSFAVSPGGSLAVVGQSGSGKTTCARIIAGLEQATDGTIEICGASRSTGRVGRAERLRRAREVQMVFQDPNSSLDPRQTASAAIAEVLGQHGDGATKVGELLEQVGLDDRVGRSFPRALSGGQRQRVAIARALAARPRLLILDEAVAALDVSVQAQVLNLLGDLREATGVAYLFVSHDLGVVRQISDDCVVMHNGRIVESGPTAQVLDAPRHEYTRRLLSAVPRPGWIPVRHRDRAR
ncbi:ABC transporter ATP-binding protein [Streptomyces sp. NBC_00459]|uniref:ABC transporter ATP-binding protein n=1 Tax=Streptomyces sp. NBC_00459 TaxID=2975749 RepID=UPI002E19E506